MPHIPPLSTILLVLVLALLLNSCKTRAAPLNSPFEALEVNQDNVSSIPTKRTLWSIVYTCFATTLACTWVAMHPNIPRNSRLRTSIFMRIMLALCALIVPEVIAFWAVVQWRAANEYTKYFKTVPATKNWTITHGFFLAMGGFTIPYDTTSESIVLHRTLPAKEFRYLLDNDLIIIPHIREVVLLDKNKGDPLAKIVAVLQTLWFALQILARFRQNLVITELEVITLALVPLNVATYCFWFHKPLGVKLAMPLQWKPKNGKEQPSIAEMKTYTRSALAEGYQLAPGGEDPPGSPNLGSADTKSSPSAKPDENPVSSTASVESDSKRKMYEELYSQFGWLAFWRDEPDQYHPDAFYGTSAIDDEPQVSTSTMWQKISAALKGHIISTLIRTLLAVLVGVVVVAAGLLVLVLILSPVLIAAVIALCITIILSPLIAAAAFRAIGHETNTLSDKYRKLRMFYAPALQSPASYDVMITISVIGATVFGGLHVLAWNFQFPSQIEHLLWKISCIVLTGLPLVFLLCYVSIFHLFEKGRWVSHAFRGLIYLGSFAYALARLYVLVEAVLALRSPIPGTLSAVKWSSFIPHI